MPRVWGGNWLARIFGRDGSSEGPIGEAWLLSDHPAGQTLDLDGRSLRDLAANRPWFPVMIKILHARTDLSVQVHPNDAQAKEIGDLGKTEGWLVLAAEDGARICYGVRAGSRDEMQRLLGERAYDRLWRYKAVHEGEYYSVPAGTVHALGAGVLALEVQQASDTTYRLYDYDRPGTDGHPRALHIEEGLRVTAFPQPDLPTPPRTWQVGAGLAVDRVRVLDDNDYYTLATRIVRGRFDLRGKPQQAVCVIRLDGDVLPEGAVDSAAPYPTWLFEPNEDAVFEGQGVVVEVKIPL